VAVSAVAVDRPKRIQAACRPRLEALVELPETLPSLLSGLRIPAIAVAGRWGFESGASQADSKPSEVESPSEADL